MFWHKSSDILFKFFQIRPNILKKNDIFGLKIKNKTNYSIFGLKIKKKKNYRIFGKKITFSQKCGPYLKK